MDFLNDIDNDNNKDNNSIYTFKDNYNTIQKGSLPFPFITQYSQDGGAGEVPFFNYDGKSPNESFSLGQIDDENQNTIFPLFGNNPIKSDNSPIFLSPNLNKQVFLPSPEKAKTLNEKKRFRGRKGIQDNNLDRRIHSASDDDNVLRKIQVHYLTFIVNFTNDVIRTFIEDKNVPQFKNLDYKIKKIVKHKVVEDFKSKTIGEILKSRISPKMKTYDSFANNNIYDDICNRSPLMEEFLQTQYINLFKEYYNNKDRKIEVNGKIMQLSSRTKTYNDLILKNYQYKDKIKYITATYFLNSYKRRKKPNFMTYTYEK